MAMQKILAVDPMHPAIRAELGARFVVDQKTGLTKDEIMQLISEYDAVIGRTSTKLDKDVIAAGTRLKCIGVHATGWDHIDLEEATRRGIAVLGFPPQKGAFKQERLQGSFIGVAEHVMLGMLAAAGDFYNTVAGLKAGRWEKYQFRGTELYGKTLGIIGLGRIGSLLADRAKAFGMRVIAYSPSITKAEAKKRGGAQVSFETLLAESDFVSVHVPKRPETVNLINAAAFKKMKKGAVLINTARAAIVNEEDLINALTDGTLRAAVIDVFEHPPTGVNPRLVGLPNVFPTPHIAGVSEESLLRVSTYIGASVADYLTSGKARGLINTGVKLRKPKA